MFKPTKKQHIVNKAYADQNGGSGGGNVPTLRILVHQRINGYEAEIVSGNVNDFLEAFDSDMPWDIFITGHLYPDESDPLYHGYGMDVLHVTEVLTIGSVGDWMIRAYRVFSDRSNGISFDRYKLMIDMDGNVTMDSGWEA